MSPRPGILVQEALVPSALRIYSHWDSLGAGTPEVHVIRGQRTFLTAEEAQGTGIPPQCLDYEGTFLDALQEKRLDWVLPLSADRSGIVQGMLEFCCVSYLGSGMTATLLSSRRDHLEAILRSLGVPVSPGPATVYAALVGNHTPWVSTDGDEAAGTLAKDVYTQLGLAGWALVGLAPTSQGWAGASLEALADLGEGSPFSNLLDRGGLSFSRFLAQVLESGLSWHAREADLKIHFKDRI